MKLLASIILLSSTLGHAGGPQYVAGSTYFDPAVQGTALAWPEGVLNYSTDRGDLSPVVPGAAADSLVATAVSRWTSIPTAAVSATRAGQLAEDVSSANVTTVGSAVSLPADILPSAVSTPVAIASLSGYGDGDYFTFPAKANHTLSVEALALDASLSPTDGKAQPVVGMWALEDPGTFPAPANTPLAFNTTWCACSGACWDLAGHKPM
ncbi:MAG: hypothetical protein DMG90_00590 [Acidobacteria bacterium]|nr:MAG: hypothetical protein DMG90_00590 [Acidobacteriota bacterium]